MPAHRSRRAAVAACAVALVVLTGCSDDDNQSDGPQQAASAAASLASKAASALASATAEAGQRFDEIKGGIDVKDDVRLGEVTTEDDGHARVPVSAENTTDGAKTIAVQVNFTDASGSWLDTVVVTLSDVGAGDTADATARSHRDLSGENGVKATVERAVRY
ncbi:MULTISPECIES: hypothetical protein [unclassified Streptomyces]|uniref:hypothetical protein n=1 Tax=unclassified Streptomyces TaxID=2593676 RepID=UPI003D74658F